MHRVWMSAPNIQVIPRSCSPGSTGCTLRDGNTPCSECCFRTVRVFRFAERTAPTRTRDTGIISSHSLRFVIAPVRRQCFPAGTECDRRFPSIQNCGHCCNCSVAYRGSGLKCGPQPPGGTPTCLPNGNRWCSGTTCELWCTGRSSFSLSRGSSLSVRRVSCHLCCSTFTCWLHWHSMFRSSRIHGDCDH